MTGSTRPTGNCALVAPRATQAEGTPHALLESVHAEIRSAVAHYDVDRYFAPDIEAAAGMVSAAKFAPLAADLLPSRAAA